MPSDEEKRKTYWRTYTLAQRDQIRDVLRSLSDKNKLEVKQSEVAVKIIRRLDTQTSDNQLVPFTLEEVEILEAVEQGLWRTH